jgi:hypothetical protein
MDPREDANQADGEQNVVREPNTRNTDREPNTLDLADTLIDDREPNTGAKKTGDTADEPS